MSYDEAVNTWAVKKLTDAGVKHTSIRNVDFDIDHDGGCIGHSDGDYCYCETDAWMDVTIYYFNGTKKCQWHKVDRQHSFEALLKELLEGGTT